MTTASNWLLNWAIAYSTPYLINSGKGNANLQAKIFFLWGGCCLICAFFVWSMVYETKGLSLEEVDELYEKVDNAWKSNKFMPTKVFRDLNKDNTAIVADHEHQESRPANLADQSSEVSGLTQV